MLKEPSDDQPNQLVHRVVGACQNIFKNAARRRLRGLIEGGRRLASLPLPAGIDWTISRGLDFDKLAAALGSAGRRPKRSA